MSTSHRAEAGKGASGRGNERKGRAGASSHAHKLAEQVHITLEHARTRHLGWAAFGLLVGALIITRLDVVGQAIGVLIVLAAAHSSYQFARTLRFPPGTIEIDRERAVLPRGLCRGNPVTLPLADVRHAYLLRRAVPWTQTGPLLVIEAGEHAYVYPRDWFAYEYDQQRVVRVLRHHLGQAQP